MTLPRHRHITVPCRTGRCTQAATICCAPPQALLRDYPDSFKQAIADWQAASA
jgi:hypothetical protein